MEPKPDTIERLLKWDKPVVSTIAFKRMQPYTPCFYPKVNYDGKKVNLEVAEDWTEGLAEVEGVGMACCLVKREVLENIPKPLFFPMPVLAEDLGFCKRVKDAGFKIYVDTSLCCGHIGTDVIIEKHYKEYRRLYVNRNNAG
jgi:GT2 family glycosyltransferase